MNFHDFIPLAKTKRWTKKAISANADAKHALDLKSDYGSFTGFKNYAKTPEERTAFRTIESRIINEFDEARKQLLCEFDSLPPGLYQEGGKDTLTLAAKANRISLENVRTLADKLGFAIIPFAYLDQRSFAEESNEVRGAIRAFGSRLEKLYDIYVLTSVRHYSIIQHVEADNDLPIYAGIPCQQAFMAINMSIPLFRSLVSSLNSVQEQTSAMARRTNRHEEMLQRHSKEIGNLNRRIEELCGQVESQQEELFIEESEEDLQETLEGLRNEGSFWAHEALMLGLKKGTSVNDKNVAIVGPCWGPDFDEAVVAAMGFKSIPKQKQQFAESFKKWVDWSSVYKTQGSYSDAHAARMGRAGSRANSIVASYTDRFKLKDENFRSARYLDL